MVGARGLVGEALLQVFKQRSFPHAGIQEVRVRDFIPDSVAEADLIILAAPAALSLKWAKELSTGNRVVIDLSEAWRLDPTVPLILSGLNLDTVNQHQGLIASPNCTNGGLVRVLDVLRRKNALRRVVVTTFQAASGGGRQLLSSVQDPDAPLHANVIPHCDAFLADGSTLEEERVALESVRLLDAPDFEINATCVRVPVEVGHGLSVWVEAEQDFDLPQIRQQLDAQTDLFLSADENQYPTPQGIRGQEGVFLGRLRFGANAKQLQMWLVTDNLLTGAASNAADIAAALLPQ